MNEAVTENQKDSPNAQRHVAPGQQPGLHYAGRILDTTRSAWTNRPAEYLSADASIAIGIGFAALTRGDWVIYEEADAAGAQPMTVAEAEALARREPEHDWCIHLVSPSQDRHYRRVGEGRWQLYRWGQGFGGSVDARRSNSSRSSLD